MKFSKYLSVINSVFIALFWLTAAIAFPILVRPYYYACARFLKLSEHTGFSTEVIHEAYNDVMDYLVFGGEFGTGILKWSESGMSHFYDCRGLFRLDFIVLSLSVFALVISAIIAKRKSVKPYRFFGQSPAFMSAFFTTVIFTIAAVWAVSDFNSLFTFFHAVCFPGKTNWIFDYRTDA